MISVGITKHILLLTYITSSLSDKVPLKISYPLEWGFIFANAVLVALMQHACPWTDLIGQKPLKYARG